jgi:hypothetical protein
MLKSKPCGAGGVISFLPASLCNMFFPLHRTISVLEIDLQKYTRICHQIPLSGKINVYLTIP